LAAVCCICFQYPRASVSNQRRCGGQMTCRTVAERGGGRKQAADHFDVHSLDMGASKNDKKIGVTAGWICRNNCAKVDANSVTKCEDITSNCWAIHNAMIVKRVAK
jgi:hypothetical protein